MAFLLNVNGFDLQTANETAGISLLQPAMHALSSLVLLGACAFQSVLGRPDDIAARDAQIVKRAVDDWIAFETPIAERKLLCNIGSNGCAAAGAASGVVVASPSKSNPDCTCPNSILQSTRSAL